ncbi:hypothetical protein [Noviherbaspirillum pedocola]|nr:hypothetical protein [Noviherbaspirillum pedocola]
MKSDPDAKAVTEGFKRATSGMSKQEQTMLTQFILRLLQLPEEYEQDKKQRYYLASNLDREAAETLSKLAHENDVLSAEDFMARALITQDVLAEKLRQHRIFRLPYWARELPIRGEELYPAFFVDPRYPLSSLEAVSMALRASPGERKYRFFTTPNILLENKAPLEALADGELEQVIIAAKAFRRNPVSTV